MWSHIFLFVSLPRRRSPEFTAILMFEFWREVDGYLYSRIALPVQSPSPRKRFYLKFPNMYDYVPAELGDLLTGYQIAVKGYVSNPAPALRPLMKLSDKLYYHHGIFERETLEVVDFFGDNQDVGSISAISRVRSLILSEERRLDAWPVDLVCDVVAKLII